MTKRMVIDTDGGVDDLLALWFLVHHPGVDLRGVIATGISRPASIVARNVALVLDLFDREDVPIALGADRPAGPAPRVPAAAMHGPEGLGALSPWAPARAPGTASPAEMVLRQATQGRIHLVTLGPLTTVSTLLDTAAAHAIASVTVMGGSVRSGGNVLPMAEANIARDPFAAARVIAHDWTVPVRLVGLDATLTATLGDDEVSLFTTGSPLRALLDHYRSHAPDPRNFPCHDLFTVAVAVEPKITEFDRLPLRVDTGQSAAWGMTVADFRPDSRRDPLWQLWDVATRADVDGFRGVVRQLAHRPHATS